MRTRSGWSVRRPWLESFRSGTIALLGALLGALFGCRHSAVSHEAPSTHSVAPSAAVAPSAPLSQPAPPTLLEYSASTRPAASVEASEAEVTRPTPEPPQRKRACRVAAVGDSLTDYRSRGGGYLRLLESRLPDSRFDNHGVGGQMVNQMRRRLPGILRAASYTHVIVFGGVNDLYSDQTANRTNPRIEADLQQMYEWARQANAEVIAVTVAPWGGFRRYYRAYRGENTRRLNAWIHEQQRAGQVDHVVDAYQLLSCGKPDTLCETHRPPFNDGLHFGPSGHELLAAALLNALDDCR